MDHVHVRTERLCLRHPRPDDAPVLAAMWVDPEVTEHLGGPRDYDEILDEFLREADAPPNPEDLWPLELLETGEVIGYCGLVAKTVDEVLEHEVIYVLARHAWGNGYAAEIANGIVDYAFGERDLDRVIAMIHADNAPSARVAERAGLRYERNTIRPSGKPLQVFVRHRGAT